MADAVVTVSARTLTDIGGWNTSGKCTVAFDTGDYIALGIPIPGGLEVSLGVKDLYFAEPAFDDATNTLVLTVDDANAKFRLWDINTGTEKGVSAIPSGASFTLHYQGRRRT